MIRQQSLEQYDFQMKFYGRRQNMHESGFRGNGLGRWGWAAAFALIFLIEAGIAIWVHDQFVRPYVGDVLVVVLVYVFVRIFFPKGVRHLPLYVFLFAASVEVSQYFDLVGLLGLEKYRAARIILGSVFDWKDIACYGVGCLLLQWLEQRGKCDGTVG